MLLPGLPDHIATLCLGRVPLQTLIGVCKGWRKLLYESRYFQALRLSLGQANCSYPYVLVHRKDGKFSWFAFDPLLSSWHPLPPMPEEVEFQLSSPGLIGVKHSVQCVSTRTKLIVVAGSKIKKVGPSERVRLEPALDSPLVFDTKKCKWMRGRPFTVPRRWCACGMVNDKLYLASGCGTEWNSDISRSAEMYDLERELWRPINRLASSKFSGEAISAVNLGGKLYMVSGRGVFARVGVIFCPELGQWTEMPCGLRDGWTGQCAASQGRLYMLDFCGRLKVYDPVQDRWIVILKDEKLRNFQEMVGAGGKLCGHVVKMGSGEGAEPVSLLRILDVSSDEFKFFDVEMPEEGDQIVAMQVLERLPIPYQLEE
ncbi:hypothetical protein O6H91_19G081000 [Diphasiastrum complanatum]|nr:hypothetical protein O6H91_19G081000 [Diphasiastrum complanatum]